MFSRLKILNANSDKVLYYIDKMVAENDKYCSCPRCRVDAAALALNTLPPHYFVDSGHKEDKDLGSPWILIEVAVREAMEKVLQFPHHQPKEEPVPEQQANLSLLTDTGTGG